MVAELSSLAGAPIDLITQPFSRLTDRTNERTNARLPERPRCCCCCCSAAVLISSLVSSRLSPRRTERVSLPVGLLVTCPRVCVRVRVAHGGEKGEVPRSTSSRGSRSSPSRPLRRALARAISNGASRVGNHRASLLQAESDRACLLGVVTRAHRISLAHFRSANRALRFAPCANQPVGIGSREILILDPQIFCMRQQVSALRRHRAAASLRDDHLFRHARVSRATRGLRSQIGSVRRPTCRRLMF